jgi:hypothetical protein
LRASNRELKALSYMLDGKVSGPDDFKDIGEKTFAVMVKKGWVEPAGADQPNRFRATAKGLRVHVDEYHRGRFNY